MSKKKVLLDTVNWAYQVLDAFKEGFNQVASASHEEKARLMNRLELEFLQKMPEFFEAIMVLCQPEHRPLIYNLLKSIVGAFESWKQTPKKP